MRSSLPLEQRVLHDRTPPTATVSDFTAFVRSAKARLVQDLKLLPTRDPTSTAAGIERHNITFYEDEPARQVLLVYAPNTTNTTTTGTAQLEFISLSLLSPSSA